MSTGTSLQKVLNYSAKAIFFIQDVLADPLFVYTMCTTKQTAMKPL